MVCKIRLIISCQTLISGEDAVLDMEGYHSHHKQERSDQTVTFSGQRESSTSPSSPDLTPGPSRTLRFFPYARSRSSPWR
jgi:hypothetical protein